MKWINSWDFAQNFFMINILNISTKYKDDLFVIFRPCYQDNNQLFYNPEYTQQNRAKK